MLGTVHQEISYQPALVMPQQLHQLRQEECDLEMQRVMKRIAALQVERALQGGISQIDDGLKHQTTDTLAQAQQIGGNEGRTAGQSGWCQGRR